MIVYPDTSFLCALYRPQGNSAQAAECFAELKDPLPVSSPLLFEFRQSLRLQSFLHDRDQNKGFYLKEAGAVLAKLEENLKDGFLEMIPVDWADVVSRAEMLSSRHTARDGTRGFDIIHVATALHLKAKNFLTFDATQRKLAQAEGLKTPL